jgi:hypothetical protein
MNTHTKTNRRIIYRASMLLALMSLLTFASTRLQADTGNCGGVTHKPAQENERIG